jgi:elongation factor G
VPLAELDGYESQLKSMTGGHGSYNIELSHYDPVPPTDIQQKLQAYCDSRPRNRPANPFPHHK